MDSVLGWTQIARSDVAKATELLKGGERGVRDEIGFLSLHQGFANRFFPGTSVLQTRLRYALFVPWQIQDLADRPRPAAASAQKKLEQSEQSLVRRLDSGTKAIRDTRGGVIGIGSTDHLPAQPPSVIYWTALRMWGILNPVGEGLWPGRGEILAGIDSAGPWHEEHADEGGNPRKDSLFFKLPPYPSRWHRQAGSIAESLDFRLSRKEQIYLRERIESAARIAPGGKSVECLFSRLAKSAKPRSSWSQAGFDAPGVKALADSEYREALQVAAAASSLAHIGRAAYSALVEFVARKYDRRKHAARFADLLADVVAKSRKSARSCRLEDVEALIGDLDPKFRIALAATLDWLKGSAADVSGLWQSYCESEVSRKDKRARLPKTPHAEELRMAWLASDAPEASPLNYRWHRVGQLLDDLHGIHG